MFARARTTAVPTKTQERVLDKLPPASEKIEELLPRIEDIFGLVLFHFLAGTVASPEDTCGRKMNGVGTFDIVVAVAYHQGAGGIKAEVLKGISENIGLGVKQPVGIAGCDEFEIRGEIEIAKDLDDHRHILAGTDAHTIATTLQFLQGLDGARINLVLIDAGGKIAFSIDAYGFVSLLRCEAVEVDEGILEGRTYEVAQGGIIFNMDAEMAEGKLSTAHDAKTAVSECAIEVEDERGIHCYIKVKE